MSEFLGARISLISRSDIRYVGILHEINSDDSTVSLENVRSFGTEGRKRQPEEEVAASDQVYEYIVFRGTDVKDLRIEQGPGSVKENNPPAVPNDPAIVGARPRPGAKAAPVPPPFQQGPPGGPGFGYFPPQVGGWGRAGGPGPDAFGPMPYPPPPHWFPPTQGFPPMGPGGPGPWNYPFPPGPGGPPGAPGQPPRQGLNAQPPTQAQAPGPAPKPAPIGSAVDRKSATPSQTAENASEARPVGQPPLQPPQSSKPAQPAPTNAPTPPVESKPTVEEVKATAASLAANTPAKTTQESTSSAPTGPKQTRPNPILPAVPLPAALTSRPVQPAQSIQAASSKQSSEAALRDATQAAKAAVALAMANLEVPSINPPVNGLAVDNLNKKMNDVRVNTARGGNAGRGGRGRGPPRNTKVEVPEADFDFASSNAKFNKEDILKEAIAGSSPVEAPVATPEFAADSPASVNPPPAYNKSKSFFDNISSEAKDRLDNNGHKPGGREWRGEEQRKNMETFGQGSVDGGYRGYRGRGRGRGRGGRGRGRGGQGGYRSHEGQPVASQ